MSPVRGRGLGPKLETMPLKGGDPAAGSPTATLLRLHPSRQPDRKRFPPKGLGRRFQVQSTPVV